ncbi:PrsW family glutamic-type intramembrane protease [Lihuaxuella thermophila]|uniref:Protease PrsW n=1 Tax=Lihuaxuella thermophila TaxID=1173111 RepID=A0A1H8ER95_9BACL|nr:PrsW family glutamic-type intramembrane protease [Lihuaxuella thermophila]SEN22005.1 Membrane proteinase PrsW, cleaves anti-sigma factor RsiW, M82 family [Lihuaxuella thermophila]
MLVLIFSAIIPAILLMIWIYTRDKINPEPKRQVLRLFIMGMIVPFPAALIERYLLICKANHDGIYEILFTAFFVAGVVEEFLKALFFQKGIYRHLEFDEPIDGVVYAAAISLGFAMVENIIYVSSFGLVVAFLRSVTAVPAHMFFGVIMGYYFSRAKMGLSPIYYAYLIPAFYHGVYDAFAMVDGFWGYVALILFLVFLMILSSRYIRKLRHAVVYE